MKKQILLFAILFVVTSVVAQNVQFGITNYLYGSQLRLGILGPSYLSYYVEYSPNNTNDFTPSPLPGGVINGIPTFIQGDLTRSGYYRGATVSNLVTYRSTNMSLVVYVKGSVASGNKEIVVYGPTNHVFRIESKSSVTGPWTTSFVGTPGQTNFVDTGLSDRFYRIRTP